EDENLHNNLLINIKNLIQLENGIEIDDNKIRVYLNEDELDKFSKNQSELDVCEKVYISSDILLTSMQESIFKNNNIEVYIIPEYYFENEIMEVMKMKGIKLKKFQLDTVNKLLDATSIGTKKEILVQAPTGSGKTIILLSYIEEYFKENKNVLFVWLTPGKGDLEEQSRKKMLKFLPHHKTQNIQDVLLQGFEEKSTAFINWETITKKGNNALKDAERKNLYERIHEAH